MYTRKATVHSPPFEHRDFLGLGEIRKKNLIWTLKRVSSQQRGTVDRKRKTNFRRSSYPSKRQISLASYYVCATYPCMCMASSRIFLAVFLSVFRIEQFRSTFFFSSGEITAVLFFCAEDSAKIEINREVETRVSYSDNHGDSTCTVMDENNWKRISVIFEIFRKLIPEFSFIRGRYLALGHLLTWAVSFFFLIRRK